MVIEPRADLSGADAPSVPRPLGDDKAWSQPQPRRMAGGAHSGLVSFTSQPADVSSIAGGVASFSVQVSGGSTSYRWCRNGFDLVDDARLSGAATATLTDVSEADQGSYSCIVTNACESRESQPTQLRLVCIGDYNQDGGVDGSDLQTFFVA